MSAVIEEKKRINAEIPMGLYKDIEASGYKITEAIIKGFEKLLKGEKESDCEQIQTEMENRVLAAESQTEARDRQISELSSWIEEKDQMISCLDTRIQKLTATKKKTWPHYIAGICTFDIWLILVSFSLGILFTSMVFYKLT
jgi:predicted RNase H-like nuclease (RuvC/YqgF family)